MSVQDPDPEISKPSEILSRPATTRAAQFRKDYTPSGKETCHTWLLNWTANDGLRICVPTSDAFDGQFDNSVKELSGIGGENAQKISLTVEMNGCSSVPLILVFTKFDNHERDKATAYTKCEEHRRSLFGNVRHELVSSKYFFHMYCM
jgi:hypothetical protein